MELADQRRCPLLGHQGGGEGGEEMETGVTQWDFVSVWIGNTHMVQMYRAKGVHGAPLLPALFPNFLEGSHMGDKHVSIFPPFYTNNIIAFECFVHRYLFFKVA